MSTGYIFEYPECPSQYIFKYIQMHTIFYKMIHFVVFVIYINIYMIKNF